MSILLVRPDQGSDFQITPPLGLGYIAAAMRKLGETDINLLDCALNRLTPLMAAHMTKITHPAITSIHIQVYSGSEEWVREYIKVHKSLDGGAVFYVVGGHHIAATGAILGATLACKTEYEEMFDPGHDINATPIPAWDVLHPERYWKHMQSANIPLKGKRPIPIVTSRGCPYQCVFCASHVIAGRKFRPRAVYNIIKEIKYLKAAFGCDEIWFSDDTLTQDISRARELFKAMIPLKVHWRAPNGIRADRMDANTASLMRTSGCYMVGLGVESGSPKILKKIKKGLDLKKVRWTVKTLKAYGIMTSGFFMVGLPWETSAHFDETVRFALDVPFDRIQVSPFQRYPGAEAWVDLEKYPVFMSEGRVRQLQLYLFLKFYMRPRVIWSLLRRLRWSQVMAIFKHPWVKGWIRH